MKRGIIIGILLALVIIIGASARMGFEISLNHCKANEVVRVQLDTVKRGDEIPLATHREQSMIATRESHYVNPMGHCT